MAFPMRQPTQFGKYLLLERVAVGGMAEVFVAKAFGVAGFERLVAIKKILPTMGEDAEFISMFVDEARIAAQLAHPNIVQVLELGKHEDAIRIFREVLKLDPAAAYGAFKSLVLPEARPNEAFCYAVSTLNFRGSSYSNIGTLVLGQVLAAVAGKPYTVSETIAAKPTL